MAQASRREQFSAALTVGGLLLSYLMYRWCHSSPFEQMIYNSERFGISCILGLLPLLAVAIRGRSRNISLVWTEAIAVVCFAFCLVWTLQTVTNWGYFSHLYAKENAITLQQRNWFYTVLLLNLCASAAATAIWLADVISIRLHSGDGISSKKAKYAVRLLPCSAWNAPALTEWLQQQAKRGLYFRTAILGVAVFAREEHGSVRYALYDVPDIRVVSRGYTYVGSVDHSFSVFMTEGNGICRLSAYTTRSKLLSSGFAVIFAGFIFLETLVLHYIIYSEPPSGYRTAAFQSEQLIYTLHIIFHLALAAGTLPGFLPICRRADYRWIGWLRRAVIVISLALLFVARCY